jgi:cytidylate kinase
MKKITIAISGLPGSGNSTTAKLLAQKLSLEYFSAGKLAKDISMGTYKGQTYFPEFKKLCDENNLQIPDMQSNNESTAAFNHWNTSFGKSKLFNNILDDLQAKLGERGGIVVDGKLALYMVKSADFKIWIKANFEVRAKRTAERDNLSLKEAKSLLSKRQEIERNELKRIYGLDLWKQEEIADLVVDTSALTTEEVTQKIISSINNKLLNR